LIASSIFLFFLLSFWGFCLFHSYFEGLSLIAIFRMSFDSFLSRFYISEDTYWYIC
jgi:hypothetical protein